MSASPPPVRDVGRQAALAVLWAVLWFALAVVLVLAALATYTVRLRFEVERLERE